MVISPIRGADGSALDRPIPRRDDAAVRWACAAERSLRGWTPHPSSDRTRPLSRTAQAAGTFPLAAFLVCHR